MHFLKFRKRFEIIHYFHNNFYQYFTFEFDGFLSVLYFEKVVKNFIIRVMKFSLHAIVKQLFYFTNRRGEFVCALKERRQGSLSHESLKKRGSICAHE